MSLLRLRTLFLSSVLPIFIFTGCGSPQTVTAIAGPAGPAGVPGLIFLGPYNFSSPYVSTDVVTYQGSSYVALGSNTNVAPSGVSASNADWAVLAQAGATGAAGPQGAVGPQGPSGPQGPAGATGANMVSFLQGRQLGVQGDSITYAGGWQKVVVARTGMTLAVQDARPERTFALAFECWGNPAVGAPIGNYNANYIIPAFQVPCSAAMIGLTNGQTLAQSLASVDMEVIALGTNDQAVPLGQLGDAAYAGTFYGNMRWVVEAYLTAKPSLRLVLVSPQYNTEATPAVTQQYVGAMVAYGQSIGVPVINMFKLGGVNALTAGALTNDGTHPNPFGFANFYGPVISQGLQQIY